jgi:carboxypeptidase Taq
MSSLDKLRSRATEIRTVDALIALLEWDQRTVMPQAAASLRGDQLGFLQRVAHERLTAEDVRYLLRDLHETEKSLPYDSDDAATIRLIRRLYERAIRIPTALVEEVASAAASAQAIWLEAKATNDFELFRPALERNFALRRRVVECSEWDGERYDVLLEDFEPEVRTAAVRSIFADVKPVLQTIVDVVQSSGELDEGFLQGPFPVAAQMTVASQIIDVLGYRTGSWRLDPTEHPFSLAPGVDDIRIATRYTVDSLSWVFSTMHEYGHGLYEHQIPRRFAHLPIGTGASPALHESQSRLWENLVGRSLSFWHFFYPCMESAFPRQLKGVGVERFVAAINRVHPTLIRFQADEVTYGLHVMLRFELEQEILNDELDVSDLPEAWNRKTFEYLGVDVPDDARGILQDIHWASGLVGFFPTYLLGTIMSVQMWEKALGDIDRLEDQIAAGRFADLRNWLGENVHAHGRKYTPQQTLELSVGARIDSGPYLKYLRHKYLDTSTPNSEGS